VVILANKLPRLSVMPETYRSPMLRE